MRLPEIFSVFDEDTIQLSIFNIAKQKSEKETE